MSFIHDRGMGCDVRSGRDKIPGFINIACMSHKVLIQRLQII